MEAIHGVPPGRQLAEHDESPVTIRWARIKEALAVRTQEDAAEVIGMPLRTFQRFLATPGSASVRNAQLVATATGMTVEALADISPMVEAA